MNVMQNIFWGIIHMYFTFTKNYIVSIPNHKFILIYMKILLNKTSGISQNSRRNDTLRHITEEMKGKSKK